MAKTIHATCVAIQQRGLLITGASGSGKSDLALRLIDRGAVLVSDDYTALTVSDGKLHASPPTNIAGLLEIRHIGIVNMPYVIDVPIALAIALDEKPERMPDHPATLDLLGISVPCVALAGLEASAPIKAELALKQFGLDVGTS
jgi:serine kinase of HPr protein (carbohydrate metabolism regulator)